jgi:hypothetical protein
MAQSSTVFITASDARQNPIRETVIHDEARSIEDAVLNAVKLGLFDCTVSDGTPMTNSSTVPTEVWTVDPATSILYVPNHGLQSGDAVSVSSTGSLPSPLVSTSYYYVIYVDDNHIKLSSSYADSVSGRPTSISITSSVNAISLTSNGSGYIQAPTVNFTGGNPTVPATATAYLSDYGSVVAISNTTSGAGYTDVPTVQVASQGSGAVAGQVTYLCVTATVANVGQNYRIGDLLSVVGGLGSATTLQVTDITINGGVAALTVANGGNYTTLPNVSSVATTVTPGGGQGCTVNLSFGLSTATLSTGGTGYIAPPKVVIHSSTGTGAEAYATLFGGSVYQIVITNPGYGYLDVSGIDLDVGSGCTGYVMLQPTSVGNVAVTYNGGLTYTATPSVTLTDVGSGATAGIVQMTVVSVQLVSGGTNYQVGDSLLISGGVTTQNAWIRVASVSATGAILTYQLEDGGIYTALPGTVNNPVVGGSGNLAAFNLSMGLYSIDVGTAGTGYVVPPVVTIDSPGGFGMTAIVRANLTTSYVSSFTIEKPGSDYTAIPNVILSNGSNATAEAFLNATTVASFDMTSVGSGYTYATITITDGGASVDATASANIVGGQIVSITLLTPGVGYTGTPSVVITGNGSNASAEAVLTPTFISYIAVTSGGSGYNIPPTVTVDGLATAVALLTGTGVDNIVVTNIGDNYVADPIVYLIPGVNQPVTPVSPVITVTRAFSVANVALTNSGEGYTSAPIITMSAPFFAVGTTATAVATIGTGIGTFVLNPYYSSRDYYAAWKGLALSNNQLSRPYTERMDTIIAYFTNLGYTINRLTNPSTNNTLMWSLQW